MQIVERLPKEYAREYALRLLKANIVSLDLAPGSMLSENELAREMGLSRTPVREALIELTKTKIIDVQPQCGWRVGLIDHDLVTESRLLRMVLEKLVVELVCESPGPLDLSIMEENVGLQRFYLENHQPDRLLELDDAFHRELFRLSNMMQTYHLMESMMVHFDRVRSMTLSTVKETRIADDHADILRAIQNRECAKAQELMTTHLNRSKIDEEALRQQYPAYFKPIPGAKNSQ